jgi:hypothetical protein
MVGFMSVMAMIMMIIIMIMRMKVVVAVSVRAVVLVLASRAVIVAAVIGRADGRTQAHLFGAKFAVQAMVLRSRCELSPVI